MALKWRAIFTVLKDMGFSLQTSEIDKKWRSLARSLGEKESVNFHIAYPGPLIQGTRNQIEKGLKSLNVNIYTQRYNSRLKQDCLADHLNAAWIKFWQDPSSHSHWEANMVPTILFFSNSQPQLKTSNYYLFSMMNTPDHNQFSPTCHTE
jgi:hypothetical protein